VVVDDFHVKSVAMLKPKTQTPMIVYAHAPLVPSIAMQFFQSLARWRSHIVDADG
jgi:hypothetical protein